MPQVPINVGSNSFALDPRYARAIDGEYQREEDFLARIYSFKTPTQRVERGFAMTPMGLLQPFNGLISYDGPDQGYEWSTTNKQFALGMQVEWEVIRFDQFDILEKMFKLLARSAFQSRQVHGAGLFLNSFSNDAADFDFYNSEGVALCSDSHTSPRSGVSTASGFDNLTTAAFSPTALKAIYIQFRLLKDDAGQPIGGHEATHVIGPVHLKDRAEEVFGTMAGLETAGQDKNVVARRYTYWDWIRLTDTNDYWVVNEPEMKDNAIWFDSKEAEYARVEDFDSIVAKYRVHQSYSRAYAGWRWVVGAQVS